MRNDPPATLDELAARLRARRAEAGSPSFGEIARRVGAVRAARGVALSARQPGRVTVYDCFRDGRRRIDAGLVLDIVRALGGDEAETGVWQRWCATLPQQSRSDAVVSSRTGLPSTVGSFVGREHEVVFASATGRTLIAGMGGAGKTRLAGRVLGGMLASGEISELVTVDVRGTESERPARASAVMEAAERALELVAGDSSLAERGAAVARRLAQRRAGLLLDDVAAEDQVRELLRRCTTTPVMVTSRMTLQFPAYVTVLELGPWGAEEGMALLRDRIGSWRVDAEPGAAVGIVELTGGLPLAAELVAAHIAGLPDWSLADHREAMLRRRETVQLDQSVQAAITASYQGLDPQSRRALRLLSTQPCEDLSDAQFAAVIGEEIDVAHRIAERLTRAHCAGRPAEHRLGLHVLVRAYAAARSWEEDAQASRDEALDRLGAAMLESAWAATEAVYAGSLARSRTPERAVPPLSGRAASAWLRSELGHLVDVMRAVAPRNPLLVGDLVEAVGRFVHEQTSLPFAEALFRDAARAVEHADAGTRAVVSMFLAQTLVSEGHAGALGVLREARAHADAAGLPLLALAAINSAGIVAGRAGDLRGARALLFEAAATAEGVPGTELLRVVVRDNAAIALHRMGDHIGAAAEHREAIRLAWTSGAVPVPVIALAHANLADPLLALGDLEGAETAAREAIALADGRSPRVRLQATAAMARAALARGETDRALEALRDIEAQEEQIADPSQRAVLHLELGDASAAVGDGLQAVAHWQRACTIAESASFGYEQARALLRLGRAEAATDREASGRALMRAAQLFAQSGDAEAQAARREAALFGA